LTLQEFVKEMPVGCFLPHAYDPLPIEFRAHSPSQNVHQDLSNPIGDAHALFHEEPDVISRAEVSVNAPSQLQFCVRRFSQVWAAEALPHYFRNQKPLVSRFWLWKMMILCADSDAKLKDVVDVSVLTVLLR
jgi:hypothetical protein